MKTDKELRDEVLQLLYGGKTAKEVISQNITPSLECLTNIQITYPERIWSEFIGCALSPEIEK